MPRLNSAPASRTRAWNRVRSRRTAQIATPTRNTTDAISPKNHTVSCAEVGSAGNGYFHGTIAPERWRKPSRWPHGGGTGSFRPPRRSKIGCRTMPLNAALGPASANWMTYPATPISEPMTSRILNRLSVPHQAARSPRPTARTRSGR